MKKYSGTYQLITKTTALLLLLAFLVPSGLQAKELVDFCLMNMAHNEQTEKTHQPEEMADDHSCCESEPAEEKNSDHNNCDWAFICACSIGQSQLGDKDWIPTTKNIEITLTQQGDLAPFFTSGHHIRADQKIRIGEYDPPLWLLYDTFLM